MMFLRAVKDCTGEASYQKWSYQKVYAYDRIVGVAESLKDIISGHKNWVAVIGRESGLSTRFSRRVLDHRRVKGEKKYEKTRKRWLDKFHWEWNQLLTYAVKNNEDYGDDLLSLYFQYNHHDV